MSGCSRLTAVALVLVAASCSRPLPPRQPSSALYRDLQRLVTVAEASEWKIDSREIDELLPDALLSVCQTDLGTRLELDGWLSERIEELGGPAADAFARRGRDLDNIEDLLEATRVHMLLRAANARVERDCPFWLSPDPSFSGRQISDDRWQLSIGGGGRGNLLFRGDDADLSFGGAGRLLIGRAIGPTVTIYAGGEIGGQASFPKDEDGNRDRVRVDFTVAVPVVFRYRRVNSYAELEAGYVTTFTEGDYQLANGFRVGMSFGARAPLARWFFPGAAFQILYDQVHPDGESTVRTIRLGVRVAIDLNL